MRGGRLDRRVRVEVRALGSPAQDPETGQPNYVWTLVAEVWARKRDARARERFAQVTSQVIADVDCVFEVRWHPFGTTLRPDTHRIVAANVSPEQVWNIVGVAEIGRREGLEISAAARAEVPVNN